MEIGKWLLPGVVGAAVAALGCGSEPGTKAAPPAPSKPAPVVTDLAPPPATEADRRDILSVLSVEHEVDVLAQRDGVVEEILLDEGARVAKGGVLARLDDRELLARLDRARAELDVQRNNVKYNEAELKARQAAYRRAQEMYRLGLNSEAELEEAEFRAQGVSYDLESSRAMVERTRADIRLLELELEKTRIRAPFSGVVARRHIRPGQTVLKDDRCFRLSQLAPLLVRFQVPETAAHRPRPGESVNVVPLSDSHRVYAARIQKVSPTVDAASGSYDITARLTEPDLTELRPGMSVRVLWPTETENQEP